MDKNEMKNKCFFVLKAVRIFICPGQEDKTTDIVQREQRGSHTHRKSASESYTKQNIK